MKPLRILPLGGLGEIGMNCMCLEYDGHIVLIDCGVQFPDSSYPGVDILTPDLSYLVERRDQLRGIVCTHGHDDHIGFIPLLARHTDLDVYCTPFPRGLIEQKLTEVPDAREVRFHEFEPRRRFRVGPFEFDPIPVQHSIIESVALAVDTPVGTIVHSGDFKHDPNEVNGKVIGFEPFEEIGKRGVLLLLSDSTNAERVGHTLSEIDIRRSFDQIFDQQSGRILIALFASNIRRIENLLWLAKEKGKKVALAGRSMHSYTRLAHGQSSMNIPEDTLILLESTNQYPDDKVIVLLTGSQAEPQSALVRISQGIHKDFQIRPGDRVIMSSRFIPGNERNIAAMIDHLYRQGAEVIYETIHQIHVSGHGFQDELLMMMRACRPKYFIPIHGEYRHLAKHAKLAREAGGVDPGNAVVIENGQVVEVTPNSIALAERVDLQRGIVVDGTFMEGSAALFSQRNNLAKTGIVFAVVIRDRRTGELIADPKVLTYGLLPRQGEPVDAMVEEAVAHVEDVYPDAASREDLAEVIRLEVRRFFRHRVSHKPVVVPLVLDL